MKNTLARCWQAGSFIAGLFIGLSIMVPVFAMVVVYSGEVEQQIR